MTLDGWSLDQKIKMLRDDLTMEMKELKLQFAMLYDYLKQLKPVEEQKEESSKPKKRVKN